mmetsp:Transcript_2617/g.7822  ORF Transcript_2617/g.7822 Transcript_2617/m.7822 type:complete len:187 (-) Transcript_2617:193-753(-)
MMCSLRIGWAAVFVCVSGLRQLESEVDLPDDGVQAQERSRHLSMASIGPAVPLEHTLQAESFDREQDEAASSEVVKVPLMILAEDSALELVKTDASTGEGIDQPADVALDPLGVPPFAPSQTSNASVKFFSYDRGGESEEQSEFVTFTASARSSGKDRSGASLHHTLTICVLVSSLVALVTVSDAL